LEEWWYQQKDLQAESCADNRPGCSRNVALLLSSASFIEGTPFLKSTFAIITPASAALLTIINGLTQSFQSGAAWRDMVLNAERLEKERDRYLATPEATRNYRRELNTINTIIVNESTAFFKRILKRIWCR
jgi:hypothetical protein